MPPHTVPASHPKREAIRFGRKATLSSPSHMGTGKTEITEERLVDWAKRIIFKSAKTASPEVHKNGILS